MFWGGLWKQGYSSETDPETVTKDSPKSAHTLVRKRKKAKIIHRIHKSLFLYPISYTECVY